MNTALKWFIYIWVALAIVINLASMGMLLAVHGLWDGWAAIREIWNPFNVVNLFAEFVLLSPALAAQYWLQRRLLK